MASTEQNELECLIRGLCGGFVFAIPVIYTMEVWWLGHATPAWKVALFVLLGLTLATGLNAVSGFREDAEPKEYLMDAITALGMGALVAWVMLWALGVVDWEAAPELVIRQVMVLSVPIAFGFSLARSLLGENHVEEEATALGADAQDLAMTVIGGIFVGLSLAPTEEILQVSLQAGWVRLAAVVGISIVLSHALIFLANFSGQTRRHRSAGMIQSPWGETFVCYVVSLAVAWGLLWFMGFVGTEAAPGEVLGMVVMLGLPVTIGGAAGRLLV